MLHHHSELVCDSERVSLNLACPQYRQLFRFNSFQRKSSVYACELFYRPNFTSNIIERLIWFNSYFSVLLWWLLHLFISHHRSQLLAYVYGISCDHWLTLSVLLSRMGVFPGCRWPESGNINLDRILMLIAAVCLFEDDYRTCSVDSSCRFPAMKTLLFFINVCIEIPSISSKVQMPF